MKLYFSPGTCSLSPHIALREAGLDFELVRVDIRQRKLADGSDFTAINRKGYVPVLELDNGLRLTEGPAIVQYIADRKPASGLAPRPDTIERYQLQEWLGFINSELHKGFSPLFRPDTPDDYKQLVRENLAGRLGYIADHLAGKDYLMGDRFTVADAYLFTVMNWAQRLKFDMSRYPNLMAYVGRVAARPAVQAAMRAEGLIQ